MSKGQITLEVPHICGEIISVEIAWWSSRGTYFDPPEYDEQWAHPERCPKCGIDLNWDTIFQDTIEQLKQSADWTVGQYVPGDENG